MDEVTLVEFIISSQENKCRCALRVCLCVHHRHSYLCISAIILLLSSLSFNFLMRVFAWTTFVSVRVCLLVSVLASSPRWSHIKQPSVSDRVTNGWAVCQCPLGSSVWDVGRPANGRPAYSEQPLDIQWGVPTCSVTFELIKEGRCFQEWWSGIRGTVSIISGSHGSRAIIHASLSSVLLCCRNLVTCHSHKPLSISGVVFCEGNIFLSLCQWRVWIG